MERELRLGAQVEYFESKKLVCAVCLEVKNNRALVLTEQDREANVAVKRILNVGDLYLDIRQNRHQLVTALKEVAERRRDLMNRICVEDLWELLHEEEEGFSSQELAEICFSEEVTSDHASATLRALLGDSLHFKYKGGLFYANKPEKIEQIRRQHELEAQKQQQLIEGSSWLAAVWQGTSAAEPENRGLFVQMLKDFCLLGPEAPTYQDTKKILGLAQIPVPQGAFELLVKLVVWKEDENLQLHRFGIQEKFPAEVLDAASQIEKSYDGPGSLGEDNVREDLTSLPILTIDGLTTRDYDDALSLRPLTDGVEVGIHIADAAEIVLPNGPLDEEALARATSLYLPDTKIPMLPVIISEGLCSLKLGEDRLALSLLASFDQDGYLQSNRFVLSRIRVQRQLTYAEANELVATDETLGSLYRLAIRLRRQRIARGALPLPLPELRVRVNSNNEIHISKLDRETPAQLLVSELMILANALAADALAASKVPSIYRSQGEPQEKVVGEGTDDLYLNYLQRRYLSRAELGVKPKPHSGLGAKAYTSWTSPIRRYLDLIIQRQLKCMVLKGRPVYSSAALEDIIARVGLSLSRAMQIKRERTRYWILKHLERTRIRLLDALVLGQGKRTYHLLLPEYLLEASLALEEGRGLTPGDHFRVEVLRVSAREEVLKLKMV